MVLIPGHPYLLRRVSRMTVASNSIRVESLLRKGLRRLGTHPTGPNKIPDSLSASGYLLSSSPSTASATDTSPPRLFPDSNRLLGLPTLPNQRVHTTATPTRSGTSSAPFPFRFRYFTASRSFLLPFSDRSALHLPISDAPRTECPHCFCRTTLGARILIRVLRSSLFLFSSSLFVLISFRKLSIHFEYFQLGSIRVTPRV